jgi:hypothetical protein
MPVVGGVGDVAVAAGGVALTVGVAAAGDDAAGSGGGKVNGPFWPHAPSAAAPNART